MNKIFKNFSLVCHPCLVDHLHCFLQNLMVCSLHRLVISLSEIERSDKKKERQKRESQSSRISIFFATLVLLITSFASCRTWCFAYFIIDTITKLGKERKQGRSKRKKGTQRKIGLIILIFFQVFSSWSCFWRVTSSCSCWPPLNSNLVVFQRWRGKSFLRKQKREKTQPKFMAR